MFLANNVKPCAKPKHFLLFKSYNADAKTFDLRLFYGLSSHKMTIAPHMRDSVMRKGGLQLKGIFSPWDKVVIGGVNIYCKYLAFEVGIVQIYVYIFNAYV